MDSELFKDLKSLQIKLSADLFRRGMFNIFYKWSSPLFKFRGQRKSEREIRYEVLKEYKTEIDLLVMKHQNKFR